jgi:hypothetical protein
MVNQKTGVFNAVCSVLNANSFDSAVKLTKEQTATVIGVLVAGFNAGEISLSEEAKVKFAEAKEMKKYCNGLLSNWLRKDLRLNGNVKHEIANPGSRAGSGDKVLKELKKLKATLTNADQLAAVNKEIEKRMEIVKAEKAKKLEIDIEQIPAELRHLVIAPNSESDES